MLSATGQRALKGKAGTKQRRSAAAVAVAAKRQTTKELSGQKNMHAKRPRHGGSEPGACTSVWGFLCVMFMSFGCARWLVACLLCGGWGVSVQASACPAHVELDCVTRTRGESPALSIATSATGGRALFSHDVRFLAPPPLRCLYRCRRPSLGWRFECGATLGSVLCCSWCPELCRPPAGVILMGSSGPMCLTCAGWCCACTPQRTHCIDLAVCVGTTVRYASSSWAHAGPCGWGAPLRHALSCAASGSIASGHVWSESACD